MTKTQATREARRRFDASANTRVSACGGQTAYAGSKSTVRDERGELVTFRGVTRGCGYAHPQPCPGGVPVYQVFTISEYLGVHCIQVSGDSWDDCFAQLDARRERDRALYAKPAKPSKPAKRAKPTV